MPFEFEDGILDLMIYYDILITQIIHGKCAGFDDSVTNIERTESGYEDTLMLQNDSMDQDYLTSCIEYPPVQPLSLGSWDAETVNLFGLGGFTRPHLNTVGLNFLFNDQPVDSAAYEMFRPKAVIVTEEKKRPCTEDVGTDKRKDSKVEKKEIEGDGASKKKKKKDIALCVICQDKKPNSFLSPCTHKVCCVDCAVELFKKSEQNKCPVCRVEITGFNIVQKRRFIIQK
jgi:hypothetical protein